MPKRCPSYWTCILYLLGLFVAQTYIPLMWESNVHHLIGKHSCVHQHFITCFRVFRRIDDEMSSTFTPLPYLEIAKSSSAQPSPPVPSSVLAGLDNQERCHGATSVYPLDADTFPSLATHSHHGCHRPLDSRCPNRPSDTPPNARTETPRR